MPWSPRNEEKFTSLSLTHDPGRACALAKLVLTIDAPLAALRDELLQRWVPMSEVEVYAGL
jgi:hypothetical protein